MGLFPLVAMVITGLVGAVTVWNWRYGLLCIIGIGVLQDVLRKLTPGVPAYFILWSMAVFGMVAIVALTQGAVKGLKPLWMQDRFLKGAFILFAAVILIHSVHSLVRWGSLALPVFGLIFYLGPFVALVVVIAYAREPRWIDRFLRVYLVIMVPVCLTIYLSKLTNNSVPVLQEVGAFVGRELIIYDQGTILYSYSGLLRVGEIAAFHCAVCIGFLSIYLLQKKSLAKKVLYAVLIALLFGAIVLTGRRKMIVALSIFWGLQFFLLMFFRRGFSKQFVIAGIAALIVVGGVGMMDSGSSGLYLARGASVFGAVEHRVDQSLKLFSSALNRSEWIGLGAGTASLGMRYSAAAFDRRLVGGSAESGVGYIAVELGIFGVVTAIWLLINLARAVKNRLSFVSRVDNERVVYAVSFAAFLLANIMTFMTATQLYGDYFVLIILGVIAGMFYASLSHAERKSKTIAAYYLWKKRQIGQFSNETPTNPHNRSNSSFGTQSS